MGPSILRRATVTATAAITALTLALPATGTEARPDRYAGTADALTLDLQLTGPPEVLGPIAGGGTLRQVLASTMAELRSEDHETVVARLGEGPLAPFAVSESREREDRGRTELESIEHGPLTAEGGVLEWAIVDDTMSWSTSEIAMLTVSLAPVLAELPAEAREPIQRAVDEATRTVNDLVTDLNGRLGVLEDTLNEADQQAPVDLPDVLPDELAIAPDVTSVDLLTVRKLWADTRVQTVDGVVRSTAQSGAAELTLLGGLVRVPALQYVSTAHAGGAPGTADAQTVVETVIVELGGTQVGIAGTVLTVGDVEVDLADPDLEGLPVGDQVAQIQQLLQDLIAAGGLSVTQGDGATEVADDGGSASAATSAFALRLRPLQAAAGAADTVDLSLRLMQTSAAVSAAPDAEPSEPALPRTGGGVPAALTGLVAMAGGVALHRRP